MLQSANIKNLIKNRNKMQIKIGYLGILGIIFIVLKLCHVIAWSWWFVLMPFYIIPLIFICIAGIIFIIINRKRILK